MRPIPELLGVTLRLSKAVSIASQMTKRQQASIMAQMNPPRRGPLVRFISLRFIGKPFVVRSLFRRRMRSPATVPRKGNRFDSGRVELKLYLKAPRNKMAVAAYVLIRVTGIEMDEKGQVIMRELKTRKIQPVTVFDASELRPTGLGIERRAYRKGRVKAP